MKLLSVHIHDFRGIEHLELDLQDELGLIQDRTMLVGPNGCGKSAVLDAIALCLGPLTGTAGGRPGLELSPSSLVRLGTTQARVVCTLRSSPDEMAAIRTVHERLDWPWGKGLPQETEWRVAWTYPDPSGKQEGGNREVSPEGAEGMLQARHLARRARPGPPVDAELVARIGGVYLFDGQRVLARGTFGPARHLGTENGRNGNGRRRPSLRRRLIDLATRARAKQGEGATDDKDYQHLTDLFAHFCTPRRLLGLVNTERGLDIEFEGPDGRYTLAALGSGEERFLRLLLGFVTEHIHHSIVLIDDLESNASPLWQAAYHAFRRLGTDNQFFVATHSTHLWYAASPLELCNVDNARQAARTNA